MIKRVEMDAPFLEILSKEAVANLLQNETSQPWYGQLMNTPQTIAYFLQINAWMKDFNVQLRL